MPRIVFDVLSSPGKMSRGNTTHTHDCRGYDESVSLIDTIVALFGLPVRIKMKKIDGKRPNWKTENMKIQSSCGGCVRRAGRTCRATIFFWRARLSRKQSINSARKTIAAAAAAVRGPHRVPVRAASSCPCSAFRFC